MLVYTPAKINLGLFVTEKRSDNYHNLESIFVPIPCHDVLEIVLHEQLELINLGENIPLSITQENLCLQAYQLLKKDFDLPPVQIVLYKNIPIGAGLGGGSGNAAYTLTTLNELFDLKLSVNQLLNYARQFGSDCAFFIENKTVFAKEKGDVFENIDIELKGFYLVLIYPNIAVSSSAAFASIQPQKASFDLRQIKSLPLDSWKEIIVNDFEKTVGVLYPEILAVKEQLYQMGAFYASMSGSGSAVFGLFQDQPKISDKMHQKYWVWTHQFA